MENYGYSKLETGTDELFATVYDITPNALIRNLTALMYIMFIFMAFVLPVMIYLTEQDVLLTLGFFSLVLAIFSSIFIGSWAYSPQKYTISKKYLKIVRPIGPIVIPLQSIRKVELVDLNVYRTFHKWGNGGLFSISGQFWTKEHGTFWVYAKNNNFVMINADKKYVVSPDERALFVKDLNSRLSDRRSI